MIKYFLLCIIIDRDSSGYAVAKATSAGLVVTTVTGRKLLFKRFTK